MGRKPRCERCGGHEWGSRRRCGECGKLVCGLCWRMSKALCADCYLAAKEAAACARAKDAFPAGTHPLS